MNNYKALRINGVKRDEHRVIMEKYLGRKLLSNEVVHHIDGNKRNNSIGNLQVLNRAEHARIHFNYENVKQDIETLRVTARKNSYIQYNMVKDIINSIREDIRLGLRNKEIVNKYNISKYRVSRIRTGVSWNWV